MNIKENSIQIQNYILYSDTLDFVERKKRQFVSTAFVYNIWHQSPFPVELVGMSVMTNSHSVVPYIVGVFAAQLGKVDVQFHVSLSPFQTSVSLHTNALSQLQI